MQQRDISTLSFLFCFVISVNSFYLSFDNTTGALINHYLGSIRDRNLFEMLTEAFLENKPQKNCYGKEFNVQSGDSFYQVEKYILLGTYAVDHPAAKHCTGMSNLFSLDRSTFFSYSIGPDWTFHSWSAISSLRFRMVVSEIMDASHHTPHINKIAWYGNANSPLRNTIEYKTRPLLVNLSHTHPQLFHFRHVCLAGCPRVSITEMVRNFSLILDIGGNGYSGRLKYLLYSNRPLFLVERRFVEYFHTDLAPFVHYIPVKSDLSDLVEKAVWAHHHPDLCKTIAANALSFALANFTTEKIYERYRTVIHRQCDHGPCLGLT
jgi:hypothetical protein